MVTPLFPTQGRASRRVFWVAAICIAATGILFLLALFVFFGGPRNSLKALFRAIMAVETLVALIFNPAGFFRFMGELVCACLPGSTYGPSFLKYAAAKASILIGLSLISWVFVVVGIRRLHDRGKQGGWVLIYWLGPIVLTCISCDTNGLMRSATHAGALAVIGWGFVELGCLRGTEGPNEYGPDPLDAANKT